ncbi:MAG: oligosaccharide flippase family protein [Oligoflexales bacterium]
MNKKRMTISLLSSLFVETINKLSPILVLHLAQMRLGTEQFGYSQFAITIMETAIPFVISGYLIVGAKEVTRLKDDPDTLGSMLSSMMILRLGHALITFLALVSMCLILPQYHSYLSIVLTLSFILVGSALEMTHVLIAHQKVHSVNLALGVTKIASLYLIYRFITDPGDANLYAILGMATNGIVCLVTIFLALKLVKLRLPKFAIMRDLFMKGSQFALIYIGLNLLDRYDVFLAKNFFGAIGAAHYMGPARISQSLHSIVAASGIVFLSELMNVTDKERFTAHIKVALLGIGFLVIPACAGIWFLDKWIMTLIFGEDYAGVARLLSVLVLAAGMQSLITIFGFQVLTLKDETKKFAAYLFAGILVGIVFSYVLAPKYALYGIGIAAVAAKITSALLVSKKACSYLNALPWANLGKTLFAASVMAGVLAYFQLSNPISIVLVATLTYGVTFSIVAKRDLLSIWKKLQRARHVE